MNKTVKNVLVTEHGTSTKYYERRYVVSLHEGEKLDDAIAACEQSIEDIEWDELDEGGVDSDGYDVEVASADDLEDYAVVESEPDEETDMGKLS